MNQPERFATVSRELRDPKPVVRYVAPSGSCDDAFGASPDAPYRTSQAAVDASAGGDVPA